MFFSAQIESKMHARRMEREAKEKEEAIAREKLRRKQGQEIVAAKAAQDEAEMKKWGQRTEQKQGQHL